MGPSSTATTVKSATRVIEVLEFFRDHREPRRRSRGGRRSAQPYPAEVSEQAPADAAAQDLPPDPPQQDPSADAPSDMPPATEAPKPRSRRPRKPAVKKDV